MRWRRLWWAAAGMAAVVGTGGTAVSADTALANDVATATVPGPTASGTQVKATARCPASETLTGGGFHLTSTTGRTPNNSLRALGGVPSTEDGSPAASGAARAWTAVGGAGGQSMTDALTEGVALCARGGAGATEVVAASVPGPREATNSTGATATCRPGTVLVGGGGATTVPPEPVQPSLHLIGSYPSDASGHASETGTQARSWTAVAAPGGAAITNATTTAYAVCAAGSPSVDTTVVAVVVPGPEVASTAVSATAGCPAGTVLLGGGVNASLDGGNPQQGIHLTGSFPSRAGSPAGTGSGADSWTAIVQTGGQNAPGTRSAAFALCAAATATAVPTVAGTGTTPPSASASVPPATPGTTVGASPAGGTSSTPTATAAGIPGPTSSPSETSIPSRRATTGTPGGPTAGPAGADLATGPTSASAAVSASGASTAAAERASLAATGPPELTAVLLAVGLALVVAATALLNGRPGGDGIERRS